MTKELTEYEINNQQHNQRLVRNEFLYNGLSAGKYDFPIIKKQDIDIDEIEFLSFLDTKKEDNENCNKTIHFFTYDWLFEKVYEKPDEELQKLKKYKYLLSPDFSIFENMPRALQIESIFKNRWCGAFWQSKGLKVIPTISWGDKSTFDFCFEGVEKGSVVAVSTYYRENCEEEFMLGYNEMLKRIQPSAIICYDEPFKSMTGNIKEFLPTTYEWTKKLSWQDFARFKLEKQNRNISGLNTKDFKFFKYDDPYVKDQLVKCSICGQIAFEDQYGNGECKNCGWKFSKDEEQFEKDMGISYPMLVSPTTARKQYAQGLPFKATFEEFIKGLYFYSEMLFKHNNIMYEVFLVPDYTIVFCSADTEQKFATKEEFENNAHIGGRLLKDIWHEVTFAGFMFCEP